ncbi:hypothetical protein V5O48_016982, partial [Marasmius crinis-equi]
IHPHPSDPNSVACRACNYGLDSASYTWMQKKNFKRHCADSSGHRDAINRQAKRKRVEEVQQQQYAELFRANPIPLVTPSIPCQPPRPLPVVPSYVEENAAAFDNEWDALTPAEIDDLYPVAATEEEARQTTP